jgi:hypothetical protein
MGHLQKLRDGEDIGPFVVNSFVNKFVPMFEILTQNRPVYIMTKKNTPLLKRRESSGLSLMTRVSRVATFSTKMGSNVKSN